MKINLHTCGAISEILPDLIQCGMDIYNPVQIFAKDMQPEKLKAQFGKQLIFWGGGYDCQMFRPEDQLREGIRDGSEKPPDILPGRRIYLFGSS